LNLKQNTGSRNPDKKRKTSGTHNRRRQQTYAVRSFPALKAERSDWWVPAT
jgi:hypothetical protein